MLEGFSVVVSYGDGKVLIASIESWCALPSEDVQTVEVRVGRYGVRLQAASIYWLYPEKDYYVVGCGSVRYDPNPLTEILITSNGAEFERKVEFMPDLKHEQVKLGWWKHG